MSDLQNMWTEGIRELENAHMHCTNNDENNNKMGGIEVIDLLCSVSQSEMIHFLREKKVQSKKVRTNRNMTEWTKWKSNCRP